MTKSLMGKAALIVSFILSIGLFSGKAYSADAKEWTVLVFLNGHNNLDSFGKMNIDQMLEVGSSDKVNVVVQWASLENGKTKRLYVNKGKYDVIEEMDPVDMGDYHQLVEFARWATKRYPAKKYMVDIWNHGNGWHLSSKNPIHMNDISYDDLSGHHITTEELGVALGEIAGMTDKKVELYASDACLMAMGEVAGEMTSSVSYFAGSQETEPGEGWPYNKFLARLEANPSVNGGELAKILSEEYTAAYSGGIYGNKEVTFSAYDLSKMDKFYDAVRGIATELKNLDPNALHAAFGVIDQTQSYALYDYKDFTDYLELVSKATKISDRAIEKVQSAMADLVIANHVTSSYARSHGLSIWLPSSASDWDSLGARYQGLSFHKKTGWGDFVNTVIHAQ